MKNQTSYRSLVTDAPASVVIAHGRLGMKTSRRSAHVAILTTGRPPKNQEWYQNATNLWKKWNKWELYT